MNHLFKFYIKPFEKKQVVKMQAGAIILCVHRYNNTPTVFLSALASEHAELVNYDVYILKHSDEVPDGLVFVGAMFSENENGFNEFFHYFIKPH